MLLWSSSLKPSPPSPDIQFQTLTHLVAFKPSTRTLKINSQASELVLRNWVLEVDPHAFY
jgi:hypothetical protein